MTWTLFEVCLTGQTLTIQGQFQRKIQWHWCDDDDDDDDCVGGIDNDNKREYKWLLNIK